MHAKWGVHGFVLSVDAWIKGLNHIIYMFLGSAQYFWSFDIISVNILEIFEKKYFFTKGSPFGFELRKISDLAEGGLFLKKEWGSNK